MRTCAKPRRMTLTAALDVGAIRRCASAAWISLHRLTRRSGGIRGMGPGGWTPPGAPALRHQPALHLARLTNKQFELGKHKHRTRARAPSTKTNTKHERAWACTRRRVREGSLRAEPRMNQRINPEYIAPFCPEVNSQIKSRFNLFKVCPTASLILDDTLRG